MIGISKNRALEELEYYSHDEEAICNLRDWVHWKRQKNLKHRICSPDQPWFLKETRVEKQTEEDKKTKNKKKTSCNIKINKILEVFCSKHGVFFSKKTVIMFYSSSLSFLMTIRNVDSRDDTGIICHDLTESKVPQIPRSLSRLYLFQMS